MPKLVGGTQVVGTLTATSVNGITGLSSTASDIKDVGTQSAGVLNTAARADHVHHGAAGSGGGATALSGLTDVDTTSVAPIDGDLLWFNVASGKQKPKGGYDNFIDLVVATSGNGTTNFTTSKPIYSVMAFVDGILQSDFSFTVGSSLITFGFTPSNSSFIEVYNFTVSPVSQTLHPFLLMGA